MTDIDLSATAADLGRAIAAGTLDPVDLTEAMLSEIKASPDAPLIFTRTTPDRARAEAKAAAKRARAGTRRSLLDGVPISWKDLFDTAGTPGESGTRMLDGRVAVRDAAVVANASAAGLVCIGKTHQTELAFSGLGLNPMTATPPNSISGALAPGGSSSGAAVSVGRNMAAAGIGSDTGGSVRVPAAWNDLVGFKTSVGSLPMQGVVPLCARFDTAGPLCRSVEDAAQLYAVMGNTRPADLAGATLKGARLLVLTNASVEPMEDTPQTAFEAALGKLSAAGAFIDHASIAPLEEAMTMAGVLFPPEAYGTWGTLIEEKGDMMYSLIRERFEAGKSVSAPAYVAAWQKLDLLREAFLADIAGYDAVLLPSCPILPPPVQALLDDDALFVERNLATLRNTRVGNLMDLTGLTLPSGVPHCGVMALAPAGHEARILRLCAAMEKSL
ncbi:amidase [Oceanibium sediminis]|uniref:amidase n=1 Tax=Oceanibium sediminis TaxID=2026339 RepID=UPI000DD2E4D3|nr:amidase family protein [Oceanibium sediminis]